MIAPRTARLLDEIFAAPPPPIERPRRPPPATHVGQPVSTSHVVWLRVLFALDVVGAGGPGLLLLLAPKRASELLFAGGLVPDAGTTVLGCVWLSLGFLSIAGLVRPISLSPVLLVQLGYKLIWLVAVAIPAGVRGDSIPVLLAAVSVLWVTAVGAALPWRALFATPRSISD